MTTQSLVHVVLCVSCLLVFTSSRHICSCSLMYFLDLCKHCSAVPTFRTLCYTETWVQSSSKCTSGSHKYQVCRFSNMTAMMHLSHYCCLAKQLRPHGLSAAFAAAIVATAVPAMPSASSLQAVQDVNPGADCFGNATANEGPAVMAAADSIADATGLAWATAVVSQPDKVRGHRSCVTGCLKPSCQQL